MLDPLSGLGSDLVRALPAHLTLRPAVPFDALSLRLHIRPADGAEIMAWGYTPEDGLATSIALADEVWAVEEAGSVIALFGCREVDEGAGHPWLLISSRATKYRKALLVMARKFIARWNQRWPLLVTWSWIAHAGHHSWLRHLGFTPINITPAGATSALCYEFVRINPDGR